MDADTETSQGETVAGSLNTVPYEPNKLQDYFDKLLPLVLGAEPLEEFSDSISSLWSEDDNTEKLKRFINDPQVNVIFFTRRKEDKKEEGKLISYSTVYSYAMLQNTLHIFYQGILFENTSFHRVDPILNESIIDLKNFESTF